MNTSSARASPAERARHAMAKMLSASGLTIARIRFVIKLSSSVVPYRNLGLVHSAGAARARERGGSPCASGWRQESALSDAARKRDRSARVNYYRQTARAF